MIYQFSITPLNSSHTTKWNHTTFKISCDSICNENGLEFNKSKGVNFTPTACWVALFEHGNCVFMIDVKNAAFFPANYNDETSSWIFFFWGSSDFLIMNLVFRNQI